MSVHKTAARGYPNRNPLFTVLIISMAVFPGVLSTSMLTMGMVQMGSAFGVSFEQFQIRNSIFFTVFASGVLIGGTAAAALGERRSILTGQLLFIAAAALSGCAENWVLFLIAQGFLAAADGFIVPAQMNLLRGSVPENRVGWAFGWFEGTLATASLLGPLIGSAIIVHASWRHVFTVLAALGLVVLVVGIAFLPRDAAREKHPPPPLDSLAAFASCLVFGQLVSSLKNVELRVAATTCLAIAVGCLFLSERRYTKSKRNSLIPWEVFKSGIVTLALLRIFLVFLVGNAFTLHVPAALASLQSLPLELIGVCFTFTAVISVVLQPILGRFADRNERLMIMLGLCSIALGALGFMGLPLPFGPSIILVVTCLIFTRIGSALFGPAQLRMASLAAPPQQRGPFMGFYMFVQFVSGAFSATLLGPVITNASGSIDHRTFDRFLLVCAALLFVAAMTAITSKSRLRNKEGPALS